MVNSISMVGFRGDNTDILSRPGKFSKAQQQPKAEVLTPQVEKKSTGTGKKIVGLAAGLVALAAALAVLPKALPNTFKVLEKDKLANAKFLDKITNYMAIAGNAIRENTYDKVVKLFSKKA